MFVRSFLSITRKLLLSTKYASPLTMLTLLPLSKPSTPPVNLLTTDDLIFLTFWKFKETLSAITPKFSECCASTKW